jgi:hypothetical protein
VAFRPLGEAMNECERLGVHALTYDGVNLCCEKFSRVSAFLSNSAETMKGPQKTAGRTGADNTRYPALGTPEASQEHPWKQ